MDNPLSNEYIGKAIDHLVSYLGVKESLGSTKLEEMYNTEEIERGVRHIAFQLGLPIQIHLVYGEKNIQSAGLARTDAAGHGMEGVIAQVDIPQYLPKYGSKDLTHFPIKIFIGSGYRQQVPTLFAIIAHELSHVVLHSLSSQHKQDEFYTDLVAPILGLSPVIEMGRKVIKTVLNNNMTQTQTITYGYLTDEQFVFAKDKIRRILEERKATKIKTDAEILELKRLCDITKEKFGQFEKYLEKLDKHPKTKIAETDAHRLILFHQGAYVDEVKNIIRECERYVSRMSVLIARTVHYTSKNLNLLESFRDRTIKIAGKLIARSSALDEDIKLIKKSIGLMGRIT